MKGRYKNRQGLKKLWGFQIGWLVLIFLVIMHKYWFILPGIKMKLLLKGTAIFWHFNVSFKRGSFDYKVACHSEMFNSHRYIVYCVIYGKSCWPL